MIAWWTDLSQREKTLVAILGGLVGVFAILMLIVRPLGAWGDNAHRKAETARNTYDLVATAASTASGDVSASPTSAVPLRQAVTAAASDWEVVLVRIGAEANGQIEVQPEPIDGDKLFGWLDSLQADYGVSVSFADIARGDDGLANAQVLVLERVE